MSIQNGSYARTVVESNEATQVIDRERKKYPRFDDLYEGLQWRLARRPESGVKILRMEGYYIIKTIDWGKLGIPVMRLLYIFNDNEVNIIAVEVI